MSTKGIRQPSNISYVLEVYSRLNRSGKVTYLDHTIRIGDKENTYIIEGGEIGYCEFRETSLALVLIYIQRMLLYKG